MELVYKHDTKGLIIDTRFNTGGSSAQYVEGLKILFNADLQIFVQYRRSNPNDHFALYDYGNRFPIIGEKYLYDKPIAVLK